jgi:hypothetical protein
MFKSFLSLFFISLNVMADPTPPSWDYVRLKGFEKQYQINKTFDEEREKGKVLHNEEVELWEKSKKQAREDYKKEAKSHSLSEKGIEYKAQQAVVQAQKQDYELSRAEYIKRKQKLVLTESWKRPVSEERELGLEINRPRYVAKNRVLYGAKNKWTQGAVGRSNMGSSYSGGDLSGSSAGNSNPSFPPPPSFDDGGFGDGFIPPPPPPVYDDGGDFPPPPPVYDDGGDFPPPPGGDGFGDFPPPPPSFPDGF